MRTACATIQNHFIIYLGPFWLWKERGLHIVKKYYSCVHDSFYYKCFDHMITQGLVFRTILALLVCRQNTAIWARQLVIIEKPDWKTDCKWVRERKCHFNLAGTLTWLWTFNIYIYRFIYSELFVLLCHYSYICDASFQKVWLPSRLITFFLKNR